MFSIPVLYLAAMYRARLGHSPKSFFDCGCAAGELVRQADEAGLDSQGIDVKLYPVPIANLKYFLDGRIKIKSILDCCGIKADLAYANGTLTYLSEETLPAALSKFFGANMLVAIHNTAEDIAAAKNQGDELLHDEPRLIKPREWWMKTLRENGFDADFDKKYGCFCAIPKSRAR
ncbi:MAG: hypothetical protein LBF28_03300 [Rickettsiales bacterium]|jgi:hypothetical protein|nr:hypothetical protein [Rickettsiales bacterium]